MINSQDTVGFGRLERGKNSKITPLLLWKLHVSLALLSITCGKAPHGASLTPH